MAGHHRPALAESHFRHPDYETQKLLNLRPDYTEEELVKFAAELKLEFASGSDWNYSNTGYVPLGIIMHRVTGKFYGDFLRERIFKPLEMTSTRVINETNIIPHRASGYVLVEGEVKNQVWVSPSLNTLADGSLYFTEIRERRSSGPDAQLPDRGAARARWSWRPHADASDRPGNRPRCSTNHSP